MSPKSALSARSPDPLFMEGTTSSFDELMWQAGQERARLWGDELERTGELEIRSGGLEDLSGYPTIANK